MTLRHTGDVQRHEGPLRVLVSNGGFKFHLAVAAAELDRRGLLAQFLTAGYPTPGWRRLCRAPGLSHNAAWRRLVDRREAIGDDRVLALWAPEFIAQAGQRLSAWAGADRARHLSDRWAMRWYAHVSARLVARADAAVFHYRAGYGHGAVQRARARGMLTVCDHSIAHPALVRQLIAQGGRLEDANAATELAAEPGETRFWSDIEQDIAQADHVLVNSDFVRQTMLLRGHDPQRVHVAYLGVDDAFLAHVAEREAPPDPGGPVRLLYAGGLIRRKGFDLLAQALMRINDIDWHLCVAGGGDAEILTECRGFLRNPRVSQLGTLDRADLAGRMSQAEVFVFPSLVEGSARVVFEAMAAGCHIVTTPNSGSIVQSGVHGELVEPGSVDALESALRRVLRDRTTMARIGAANRALVQQQYRQQHYGERLVALYEFLLGRAPPAAAALSLS